MVVCCYTARGTRPGAVAVGAVVMAVWFPVSSPLSVLLQKNLSEV